MPMDQWRKNRNYDRNQGRPLPETPREEISRGDVLASTPKQPQQHTSRTAQPMKADFFVSVPIFTETLNHSFRKKNEYVYVDRTDDETSVYHQSLSRGSSLRDLRPDSARRPPTGPTHYTDSKQTSSVRRHRKPVARDLRRRRYSGSEASYNTYSSHGTYSYESETFENARVLQGHRGKRGLNLDSDEEDLR